MLINFGHFEYPAYVLPCRRSEHITEVLHASINKEWVLLGKSEFTEETEFPTIENSSKWHVTGLAEVA